MPEDNNKPQIVIICDAVPYPTRSGDNQRIAELIDLLRERGWYVHLLLCGFIDPTGRKTCRSHVDALHVYSGAGWKARIRNGARRMVRFADRAAAIVGAPPLEEMVKRLLGRSVTPLIIDYWQRCPVGLEEYVAGLSTKFRWKTAIVEYIWLHTAADKLPKGTVRLLDTHDLQHKRVEEFASRGMSFPLQITREQEARIFDKFDAVIAIQAKEAAMIREMCPQSKVLTAGFSGLNRAFALPRPENGRILYIGGYNGANIDGLRRFLNHVWPEIRARTPDAKLRVCGYIRRAFLGEQFENVAFLGHRESVEDEYAAAAVVINPVWIGTGLKIKSIEALARAKALVTTSKGVEGLPSRVRASALVTDDDEQFAAECVRLLTDHDARQSLCRSAAEFANLYLNRIAVYRELLEFLEMHR